MQLVLLTNMKWLNLAVTCSDESLIVHLFVYTHFVCAMTVCKSATFFTIIVAASVLNVQRVYQCILGTFTKNANLCESL